MNKSQQKGFTLVEMSIVLVIIGLIVGGVLVGQDLVKGAQIRATVSQIESFNSAINTFRGKYDCMPGDCAKAVAYGLTVNGDGDGIIEINADATAVLAQETSNFWVHLSDANMVAGNFSDSAAVAAGIDYPATKLKKGGITIVNNDDILGGISAGTNVWIIGTATDLLTASLPGAFAGNTLNGADGFGIDNKLDDGMPSTGQAVAFIASNNDTGALTGITLIKAVDTFCIAAFLDYSIGDETNECTLAIKVQG